jgi:hypothetical protein
LAKCAASNCICGYIPFSSFLYYLLKSVFSFPLSFPCLIQTKKKKKPILLVLNLEVDYETVKTGEKMQNKDMLFKLVFLLLLLISLAASEDTSFTYLGFQSANLSLDGIAGVTSTGLLKLTNDTKQQMDHAFYPNPITFKNSYNGSVVFAIYPEYPTLSGHGIAFVIAPTRGFPGALPSQWLGLFNTSNNGNATNRSCCHHRARYPSEQRVW